MSLLGAFLTATLENSGEPHKKNWKLTPKKKTGNQQRSKQEAHQQTINQQ
jgi:hypothetical protein